VAKLFWDVRCDRHALLFPWGVDVDGAVDLQRIDLAQQVAPGRTPRSVSGLGWVLENTSRAGWSTGAVRNMAVVKRAAKSLFAPEKGGSYSVWREGPLAEVLIEYCTQMHVPSSPSTRSMLRMSPRITVHSGLP
jgi:exonuclease 3'-5' domain-containing protein 1